MSTGKPRFAAHAVPGASLFPAVAIVANSRMLHRNVSVNEQLADCSILARLLYTWGLPHTSDYGVLAASPRRLKAQVFPISSETPEEVGEACEELVAAGLWKRFEDEGHPYIVYPTFDKYQRVDKRTSSPRDGLPLPPTYGGFPEVPGSSRHFSGKRSEEKRREEKGREENARAPEASPDDPDGTANGNACNSPLVGAAVAFFARRNPQIISQAKAQQWALTLAQLLGGTQAVTEARVVSALRGEPGALPAPDTALEEHRWPDRWLSRIAKLQLAHEADEPSAPREPEPIPEALAAMIRERTLGRTRQAKRLEGVTDGSA